MNTEDFRALTAGEIDFVVGGLAVACFSPCLPKCLESVCKPIELCRVKECSPCGPSSCLAE